MVLGGDGEAPFFLSNKNRTYRECEALTDLGQAGTENQRDARSPSSVVVSRVVCVDQQSLDF